ncbi:hypothetical protein EIP86_009610 [Pleurotus ostreatoroseus]|nr:hypothetical protein EIP86_009610 [Pleurotus ostreatoroseus]
MEAITKTSMYHLFRADPLRLPKTVDTEGLVWIEPTPDLIVGDIKEYAQRNQVAPARIAGYWFGSRLPLTKNEKIIYELHGGAYVLGDASPVNYLGNVDLCKGLLMHNQQFTRAFQLEYRLSQGPPLPSENPFPAALIDAVAGYHYLVKVMGFNPSNILLVGESAGAGLAITLLRYLIQHVPSLPPPAATLLVSPGADWGTSHWGPHSSVATHISSDFIGPFHGGYPARAFVGDMLLDEVETNPWISPASKYLQKGDRWFQDFPPTLIVTGGMEMLLDANRYLRERMRADMGDRLAAFEIESGTHMFMNFTWQEPERTEGLKRVAKWLSAVM